MRSSSIRGLGISASIVLAGAFAGHGALAAGKARPQTDPTPAGGGTCTITNLTTPAPIRPVVIRPIETKPFPLPNGQTVDLSADMGTMLGSIVTGSAVLAPADFTGSDSAQNPCAERVELRTVMTALELNVIEAGITIGYNPISAHSGAISNLQGTYNVKVSVMTLDMSLWKCHGNQCVSIAAGSSNQNILDQNLTLSIDFSQITTAASLMAHPVMSQIARSVLTDAFTPIGSSSRLHELAWQATVRAYNPQTGVVTFDQGTESRLGVNQAFTVYASDSQSGQCPVYRSIASVHSTRADAVSSQAVIDESLDPTPIQVGDAVMIRVP